MLRFAVLPLAVLGGLALSAVGCSKPAEAPKTAAPSPPTVEMGAPDDPAEAEIAAELAKLDEADRTAAVAQRDCPVSGERLGSMPGVLKVTVEGRDVFLCCDGCKEKLEAEPAKYLAIIEAAK